MRKNPDLFLSTATVFFLTVMILVYPAQSLFYACNGLNLWFQKMIPTLFPFMVLSGIMIRMNLTDSFVRVVKPLLMPLFRVNASCLYVIVIGFLCGFPMGAVVIAQLYERNRITKQEAEFLLAFCNNIGPVYFLSFALPAIGILNPLPFLFGMYGIPLLYGLFLRYTKYRSALSMQNRLTEGTPPVTSFLQALDESVSSSLTSITKLGGYMIFFNLLNVIPALLLKRNDFLKNVISAFLEITGGIQNLADNAPVISLCLLTFGGLSCIAQTNSSIQSTDLSLKKYVIHKLILTLICAFYYGLLI
ncbi:MAG: hypothetical protein ACI4ED_08105 [Suilimivivens sp.]